MDIKKKIYDNLNIEDSIIENWKETNYSMDMNTSLEFQGYVSKADKIIILGDYDCDGICGSHIFDKGLRSLYPDKDISIKIPMRSEGYGLNDRIVNECIEESKDCNTLIVTVDTGITAKNYLEKLKDEGCSVILTDHHNLGDREQLPNVDMVIDPSVTFIPNPLVGRNWCGAAVAYKIMENLVSPSTRNYLLGFAGIASVADVIEMREGSWQLVRKAIESLRANAPENLKILTTALGRDIGYLSEDDIGYYIAPAFNAPGRLEENATPETSGSSLMLNFLNNPTEDLVNRIVELNKQRKEYRDNEIEIVRNKILAEHKENFNPIWVYVEGLHKGIIGLIAGHLTEELGTSVCVCTNDGENIRGSGRSYRDDNDNYTLNLYDYLTTNQDKLVKFGGHIGAAGFSLTKEGFKALEDIHTIKQTKPKKKSIDIELNDIPYVNRIMLGIRPFGEGYKEPMFKTEINLEKQANVSMIGKEKNHLNITSTTPKWKAIHFRHTESKLDNPNDFTAYGKVHSSYFKGQCTPEFNVEEVEDIDSKDHSLEIGY